MRYLIGIFLLHFALCANAQQVVFRADCNAKDVVVGNPFKVSFELQNADIRNINFPNFDKDGFTVVNGPINESKYMSVNGKSNYSEAYIFILSPKKTGKLTIGEARVVTSKGKTMTTKTITVNSVAKNNSSASGDEHNLPSSIAGKVIFRMEPSTTDAVPGEQIQLNLKVYTQLDLTSIELTKEPKSPMIDLLPLSYYDREARVDVLNGRQYASKIIYSFSFFAPKSGTLEINPSAVQISMGRNSASNPFSKPQLYPLISNSVKINIKDFDNAPKTFSGAVGQYEMFANIEKTNITTDDALKVLITVSGDGDIKKVLNALILFGKKEGEPFEIYPPKISEKSKESDLGFEGIKDFEFTLNPQDVGDFEIRPTFTYYDIKSDRFVTIDTLIKVRVIQGKRQISKTNKLDKEEEASDSKEKTISFTEPISKAVWHRSSKPFFGSFLFWGLALIPIILFAGLAGSRFYLQQYMIMTAKKRERTKAERELGEGLQQAAEHLKASDQGAFYQSISEIFKNFLGSKLGISKAELTKEILAEKLEGKVDDEHIRSLTRILKICEVSVFAGQNNNQAMQRIYDDSRELLNIFAKSLS